MTGRALASLVVCALVSVETRAGAGEPSSADAGARVTAEAGVTTEGLDGDAGGPGGTRGAPPPDLEAVATDPAAAPRTAPALVVAPTPAELPKRLAGRVLARGTRKPVPAAGLIVDARNDEGVDAGPDGRFELELPCGRHHLTIQAPGFEPLTLERDPCADGSPLVVRLTPRAGLAGYETVVRVPTGRQELLLEGGELLHTPGTLGDPFRAVESLPGVTSVAWPAPIYAVRGSNPGNTGFFLDELRVPALFHFAIGPSVIHPYFFQDLDFFAGGYPARYGRYVAGIVAARTRAAPEDDPHASVDVRLFDAGAMVTAPLPGQGGVAVAARYSYTGTVIGLLSDDDVRLGYWDYQLRADRKLGPVRVTLLAFGSNDRLTTSAHTVALGFHRVKLRGEIPAAGGLLSASVAVGKDHTETPIADTFLVSIDAVSLIPRLAYVRHTRAADFEAGLDGEIQRFAPLSMIDRIGQLDLGKRRTARLVAGYLSATLRAGARLVVTPELRLDTYAIGGAERADLGPRLAARLQVTGDTWVKVSGGRFTQLPSLPIQVPGAENFGLALYGLQRSWQGAFTVGTSRLAAVEASATGYLQRYVLTDVRDPAASQTADPFADDFLVPRQALSYGVELLVRRAATERLHGWLSYTLSNNQRALGGGVIGPSDWDQRHVLNLVVGYRWHDTTFGGRAHFNTGRPVLVDGAAGQTFERLPPFFQLDLRCDRRFVFDAFTLDAYLELVNATLSRQVTSLSQERFDEPPHEESFRIVLPTIGVHAEF